MYMYMQNYTFKYMYVWSYINYRVYMYNYVCQFNDHWDYAAVDIHVHVYLHMFFQLYNFLQLISTPVYVFFVTTVPSGSQSFVSTSLVYHFNLPHYIHMYKNYGDSQNTIHVHVATVCRMSMYIQYIVYEYTWSFILWVGRAPSTCIMYVVTVILPLFTSPQVFSIIWRPWVKI